MKYGEIWESSFVNYSSKYKLQFVLWQWIGIFDIRKQWRSLIAKFKYPIFQSGHVFDGYTLCTQINWVIQASTNKKKVLKYIKCLIGQFSLWFWRRKFALIRFFRLQFTIQMQPNRCLCCRDLLRDEWCMTLYNCVSLLPVAVLNMLWKAVED